MGMAYICKNTSIPTLETEKWTEDFPIMRHK